MILVSLEEEIELLLILKFINIKSQNFLKRLCKKNSK
jgi:hypothetical protein